MKKFLAICFAMLACVYGHAQTATSSISGSSVVTTVTDAAGNVYTVTTPFTVTVDTGTPSLSVKSVPPPPPPTSGAPTIPSNAVAVDLINPKAAWKNTKDAGTPGTATFSNTYPVSGIFADDARAFSISYTSGGGVRFSNSFAKDTTSTNFVYDAIVQSPDWSHVADLEMDNNQVKANGQTAILGVQCASQEGTWDVTLNSSTGGWHWVKTNVACSPLTWTPNVPHHIRIFGSIDAQGNAIYEGVELDGKYSPFVGASGPTIRALGWSVGSVVTNFQIDGYKTSGSATVYSDRLTIYRW